MTLRRSGSDSAGQNHRLAASVPPAVEVLLQSGQVGRSRTGVIIEFGVGPADAGQVVVLP